MAKQLSLFPPLAVPLPRDWVYVLTRRARCGQIYKIGHSGQPVLRARTLDRSKLVSMFPGGPALERQLHRRFARDRIPGTEWFLPSRDLVEWVDHVASLWN